MICACSFSRVYVTTAVRDGGRISRGQNNTRVSGCDIERVCITSGIGSRGSRDTRLSCGDDCNAIAKHGESYFIGGCSRING